MGTMRAAVFESIENMVVREVPIPECEEDGILIKVESCGICGGDIRNFHIGLRHGVKSQIMGHEIAGTVYEAGSKVTRFKVGDRVALAPDVSCGECYYCKRGLVNLCVDHKMLGTHWPGGFAEYIYIPGFVLSRGFVEPIPEGLSFDEAALGEPASSVIACQKYNNVTEGDTVVIIGDGPIGCIHIEVARARGASKIIMVGLTRLDSVPQFNPDHIIDAGSQNPVEEVLKLTNGLGADIVICANPVTKTQQQAVEMVRKRGRVVLFGGVPKTAPMTELNSNMIHYNELTVVGAFSYPSIGLEEALRYIAEGKISAKKYVTEKVTLDHIPEGMKLAQQGKALKVIVKPWER
ncbi:alcohol dehydrogenase catalytic domain-containing protein [Defluviitalea saccharophila]|uniref:Alcohol dehydrogenase catalytic domain-containing protein n=1 Tax=Defluviitalea saccharophila TaxID=879970 RepID=A0ABZ2Y0Y5_9FIRM|nr:alcohol dehydrogenase catalytic domain-containing protein [Candidatus Epulonipiscium sp.]